MVQRFHQESKAEWKRKKGDGVLSKSILLVGRTTLVSTSLGGERNWLHHTNDGGGVLPTHSPSPV